MGKDVFSEVRYNLAKAKGLLDTLEAFQKGLPPGPSKGKPLSERKIKGASRTPPKEYKEGGASSKKDYADALNYKYPIDTEKHVRAAMSYFSQPANYGQYSTSERKTMAGRICRAAKKFNIDVSDEWKAKFGLPSKPKR